MIEIFTCIVNAIRKKGIEINEILSNYKNLYENLLKHDTVYKSLERIKGLSLEVAERIHSYSYPSKNLVMDVIAYIKANYDKELSIKTLAQRFNISSAYLGQLLKKETGVLFSDYLNSIRIGKARELLEITNLKANEISEYIGYTDPNYFYRVFKKYVGLYPSEYRDTEIKLDQ